MVKFALKDELALAEGSTHLEKILQLLTSAKDERTNRSDDSNSNCELISAFWDPSTARLRDNDRCFLYAWTNSGLVAIRLSEDTAVTTNVLSMSAKSRLDAIDYSVLYLETVPLVSSVKAIVLNETGSRLALVHQSAITIVFLPPLFWSREHWSGRLDESYLCKTELVHSQLYSLNPRMIVKKVRWHPGSIADRHLVVLTSDDTLRIYDTEEPSYAKIQVHAGSSSSPSLNLSNAAVNDSSSRKYGLAEKAVSFDFGAPVGSLWPIFILMDSGDVYSTACDMRTYRSCPSADGPLRTLPPSTDNYGGGGCSGDACDLLCLRSAAVPLLAVATTNAVIYLSLPLQHVQPTDDHASPSYTLHVYESVEIEQRPTTLDLSSGEQRLSATDVVADVDEGDGVVLLGDPSNGSRLLCRHHWGVHALNVERWTNRLKSLSSEAEPSSSSSSGKRQESDNNVTSTGLTIPSEVEYVICGSGVARFGTTSVKTSLIAIGENWTVFQALVGKGLQKTSEVRNSAFERPAEKEFIDEIRAILHHDSSTPLFRNQKPELTEKEVAELVLRSIEVLRKEYVEKLDKARHLVDQRITTLQSNYRNQISELIRLDDGCNKLLVSASNLTDRLQLRIDAQTALKARLDQLVDAVGKNKGPLSAEEQSLLEQLMTLRDRCNDISKLLVQRKQLVDDLKRRKKSSEDKQRRGRQMTIPLVAVSCGNPQRILIDQNEQKLKAMKDKVKTFERTVDSITQ